MLAYLRSRGFEADAVARWSLSMSQDGSRLLIPVCGYSGRPVAWSGRALRPDVEPKYKNSPGFHKERWLYGLQHPCRGVPVLVEGQVDVWAVDAVGYSAYAVMGSEISDWQCAHVRGMSDRCILYPDGDGLALRWAGALHRWGVWALTPQIPYPADRVDVERKEMDPAWLFMEERSALIQNIAACAEYAGTCSTATLRLPLTRRY
jgi:hypothetical protein